MREMIFDFRFSKKILFTVLLLVNVLLLNAQTPLSTSDILASAKNQYVLQLQNQRVGFLKNATHKLPLVDEMEFRTETNDFQLSEQRYALREDFIQRHNKKHIVIFIKPK